MEIGISSARGLLSLFKDEDPSTKAFALQKLSDVSEYFWHQIASHLSEIQLLAFNFTYPHRELAAYLSSQIHYHLENYSEALQLALQSGPLFDISSNTHYSRTLVSRCIDEYIKKRVHNFSASEDTQLEISQKMEFVVERMFEKCYTDQEYHHAIGIALESRRVDKLAESIRQSGRISELLQYAYTSMKNWVFPKEFKNLVVKTLVEIHLGEAELDYASITECQFFLNDPVAAGHILTSLVSKQPLFAYQLAFDLVENQNQAFLDQVASNANQLNRGSEVVRHILSGRATIDINFDFLSMKNDSDKLLMAKIKTAVEHKNSITHGAAIFANAFMNCGTGDDLFLRDNLNWVGKATNWSKFSAAASVGVIHKGNIAKAMETLRPYLPNGDGSLSSQYSEGGALYALGLIHANYQHQEALQYVLNCLLTHGTSEVIQHGGCLGLGLIGMASGNTVLYEHLKQILYNDSANSGEAASYGIGLIMLGTANPVAIQEMITYAHDTQHQKIIRALGLGLALTMYGKQEEAEGLITQLVAEKDAILRYGGIYTMAMAYVGTANGKVIKQLLHIAVSDVDYDVRKAAVTSIGFVLYKMPEMVPKVVALLAESYNPFVRQGAAMAIGIACAGCPIPEALQILEPLLTDNTNFVRQAAYIAMSMTLIQSNKHLNPKFQKFKESIDKVIQEKHQDLLAKMGAIVAYGILNAGGRNAGISLQSRSGYSRPASVVGLLLGIQYWYWFPLLHMFSLTFSPTAIIGVNSQLNMPQTFMFKSKAKPSLFSPPAKLEPPSNERATKLTATVLSTTNKVRARGNLQQRTSSLSSIIPGVDEETPEEVKQEVKQKPPTPEFDEQILANPSRVIRQQEEVIEYLDDCRYSPAVQGRKYGIVLIRDSFPDDHDDIVGNIKTLPESTVETEVPMPEEFEFDPEAQEKGE